MPVLCLPENTAIEPSEYTVHIMKKKKPEKKVKEKIVDRYKPFCETSGISSL